MNNFAISSDGIGEALQRSAAAMAAGNNNLDETIGLITAANTVAQDPKKVGTTLKTVSMYLRSSKTELEDAGESTDGMVESVSKLRGELLALTGGKVDIVDMNGAYKSTYDILKELSGVWDDLSDLNQANILEKIGGKRNANIVSAILNNFDIAEKAMETSANSAGSALVENEKYLDSINGRIAVLKATWEDFSQSILSGDVVKTAVSGATALLDVFSKLTNMVDTPALLAGGYVGFKGIARAAKGKGQLSYNLFDEKMSWTDKSSVSRIKEVAGSFKQMRADGVTLRGAMKDTVSTFWRGSKGTARTQPEIENTMNNMLHYQKEIDRLSSYDSPAHAGQLAKAQDDLRNLQKLNPAMKEYIENQNQIAKDGGTANYTSAGFTQWAKENDKALGGMNAKMKLASVGTQALNVAMGALQGMAVAAVIQGITFTLGALHKELFTTAEELQTAKAAAQDYQESMNSFDDYDKRLKEQRAIYNSPTSTLEERHAAYEQISSIQSELIEKYGSEAAGLNLLTSSAQDYANAMNSIRKQESYDLLYGNNAENFEGIFESMKKMSAEQHSMGLLGSFDEKAFGADRVLKDIKAIADKYEEVGYEMTEYGWALTIDADPSKTMEVINSLNNDIQSYMGDWRKAGIDASTVFNNLGNASTLFTEGYSRASDTVEKYGAAAEAGIQSRIALSNDYSNAADDIMTKEEALRKALSDDYGGDEDAKRTAVGKAVEDLKSIKLDEVVASWGENKAVDNYLQGMIDDALKLVSGYEYELDLNAAIKGDTKDNLAAELNDTLKSAVGDMDIGRIKDLYQQWEMGEIAGMTQQEVAAMEKLHDVSKHYNITVDNLLYSLREAGVAQGELSSLAYDSAEQLSKATSQYEKAMAGAALNSSLKGIGENQGVLNLDTYKNLISASSDFAKAVDYENGYVTLNIEKARDLAKTKADVAKASIEEQKATDSSRYKNNLSELYELMSKSGDDYSDGVKSRIAALQAENEEIAKNIGMYNVYLSELQNMSSAYTTWKGLSESNNSNVVANDMNSAIKYMKEAREKGQTGVGNVQYQMAVEMLVPDDVEVDDVGKYITNKLGRYFKENHPEKGVQNWLTDMVEAGWMTEEDGNYKLIDTANLEQAAASLHITRDAMEALVGLANMYAQTELKFNDPADISNGIDALNEYTAKYQKLNDLQKSGGKSEDIDAAKKNLSEISAELAELPEDTRIALGIKVLDENGNEVQPSEVGESIVDSLSKNEGKYSIDIQEDGVSKLAQKLSEIQGYNKKLALISPDDKDSIDYYNGKISEASQGLQDLTKQELGIDVDMTSIDGLLEAMKLVGDDANKKQVIQTFFEMHGDVEIHEKLSEVRNQINELQGEKEAKLKVNPHADTSEIDDQIAQLEEKKVTLEGHFEVDGLDEKYTQIENLMNKIRELKSGGASGEALDIETKEALEQIELLNQEIQELGGEPIPIPLDWDQEAKDFQEIVTQATKDGLEVKIVVRKEQVRDQLQSAVDGLYLVVNKDGSVSAKGGVTGEKVSPRGQEERYQPSGKHSASRDKANQKTKKDVDETTKSVGLLEKAASGAAGWFLNLFSIDNTDKFNNAVNTTGENLQQLGPYMEKLSGLQFAPISEESIDYAEALKKGLVQEYGPFMDKYSGEQIMPITSESVNRADEMDRRLEKMSERDTPFSIVPDFVTDPGSGFETVKESITEVMELIEEFNGTELAEKAFNFSMTPFDLLGQKIAELAELPPIDILKGLTLDPLDSLITKLSELTGIDIKGIVIDVATFSIDDAITKIAQLFGYDGQSITMSVIANGVTFVVNKIAEIAGIKIGDKKFKVTPEHIAAAKKKIEEIIKKKIPDKKFSVLVSAGGALATLGSIISKIAQIRDKTVNVTTKYSEVGVKVRHSGVQEASGTRYAPGGRTLVGELGPEIVASKGRYYVVGEYGAELVNLQRGDIVFNHKDTEKILKGKPGARGQSLADGGVVREGDAFSSGSINLRKALSVSKTSNTKSSSKASSSSSSSGSKRAAKSLTTTAKKATDDLDKKVEEAAKELTKILENFDAATEVALKSPHGNLDDIIKTYKDAQNEIHKQAEKYRNMGIDQNSKYINELKSQWYDYKEKVGEAIKKIYEDPLRETENIAKTNELYMNQAMGQDKLADAEKYLQTWIDALDRRQELLEEAMNRLKKEGFSENSEEVSEMNFDWIDAQEAKLEAQIGLFDAINDKVEATSNLYEKLYDTSIKEGNRHNLEIAQSYMLGSLKAQQDVIESQIIIYRDLGYSDASKEIKELQTKWYEVADAVDEAREKMIESLNDIVEAASDAVDKIQDVYKTLHDAADEYAENGGFISVDTFQEVMKLGPEYMAYLKDENDQLVINDKTINRVIAAKTEQAAVESALSYIERVKIALLSNDAQALQNLLTATTDATNGTWGFAYATASLLKDMGLTDEQFKQMMWNLDSFRSLADNAIDGLDKLNNKDLLDNLKDSRDDIEDFIEYVMDMLKDRLEEQIDKLEELQDSYKEIIDLKKESLRATKEENDYQKEIADKVKEASKLQSQIQALSMDDSREARAQRLKLEEQLADIQSDMADKQSDYALDRQEEMLDDMSDAYEKAKDEEIEKLKETYSSKEKLYQAAVQYVEDNWSTVYQEVLDWNYEMGSVLNREITEAWLAAQTAVEQYGGSVRSVLEMIHSKISEIQDLTGTGKNEHHDILPPLERDHSFTDDEKIQAIVNLMEENSANWANGEHTESHATNQYLAELLDTLYGIETTYNDKKGEWYIKGTDRRLYDLYGTGYATYASPGEAKVNEAVMIEDILQTAEAMRQNSAAWLEAKNIKDDKERKEKQSQLAANSEALAADLEKKYGFVIDKNNSGKWIIVKDPVSSGNVGENFLDTYTSEYSAKEWASIESEGRTIENIVNFIDGVSDKVSDLLSNVLFTNSVRDNLAFDTGAFGSVSPTQEYNISFGDTYITGTAEENIAAHQKITREFANDILKQLNIKR